MNNRILPDIGTFFELKEKSLWFAWDNLGQLFTVLSGSIMRLIQLVTLNATKGYKFNGCTFNVWYKGEYVNRVYRTMLHHEFYMLFKPVIDEEMLAILVLQQMGD